jgi:hypothetical protein
VQAGELTAKTRDQKDLSLAIWQVTAASRRDSMSGAAVVPDHKG